ncbi:hypothetical protein C0J52_23787 [Blattella germanica]|nr:hypothetical protein C0J52_23787 [Blattella germanica]
MRRRMSFSSVGFSVRQQPTIMDCEKLIHLIQERKYLWDQKKPQYHMRNVQMKLWKEVATEMKEPVEEIKKRWRNLRDSFRRELKKKNYESKSGSGRESSNTWAFFNQMTFLTDTMQPKSIAE